MNRTELLEAIENIEYETDSAEGNAKAAAKLVSDLRYDIDNMEDYSDKISDLETENSDLEDRVAELEEELEAAKVELDNVLVNPS